ncbi:MAG: TIGR00730 family Rossman fold protein [Saprospiraceae bacterium]
MKSICVFCGSNVGTQPTYAEIAWLTGNTLAQKGIRLVYGAGNIGLMGVMADAALEAGGQVLGVIPDFLKAKEVCHTGLTELIVTKTMHQRKQVMEENSDGFIILPGGFGTLDEFFEILTWRQLKLHNKPIGLLNVEGYYSHLIAHIENMRKEGFVRGTNLSLVTISDSLEDLLEKLQTTANIVGE